MKGESSNKEKTWQLSGRGRGRAGSRGRGRGRGQNKEGKEKSYKGPLTIARSQAIKKLAAGRSRRMNKRVIKSPIL